MTIVKPPEAKLRRGRTLTYPNCVVQAGPPAPTPGATHQPYSRIHPCTGGSTAPIHSTYVVPDRRSRARARKNKKKQRLHKHQAKLLSLASKRPEQTTPGFKLAFTREWLRSPRRPPVLSLSSIPVPVFSPPPAPLQRKSKRHWCHRSPPPHSDTYFRQVHAMFHHPIPAASTAMQRSYLTTTCEARLEVAHPGVLAHLPSSPLRCALRSFHTLSTR